MSLRVLVVNNYDSFVHTLVGYLRELGSDVTVMDADTPGIPQSLHRYDAVMLSPGPGHPQDSGATVAVAQRALDDGIPLLGVCLGHQAIGAALGMAVTEAPELRHGHTSAIVHDDSALFDGIPSPMTVGRYHSLALAEADFPAELRVTARAESGTVMAFEHEELPCWGVQFHPESVLTEHGYRLLANWLEAAGDEDAVAASEGLDPRA